MIDSLWRDLSGLALDLNSDKFHVFLDFAGHVNSFALVVYKNGYKEDSDPVRFSECISKMNENNLKEAINWLCREYESDNET